MASKFDLFYISLLIYCSIKFNGTASNNESEKSTRRRLNKWSAEEEKKLIFFDVVTDDGKGNQFNRIKALWHEAYPDTNVTDIALHRKLHRLRHESQEEGEYRKYFKWDHERKTELLDVRQTTQPYKTDADITLEEEWSRRYKDCQLSRAMLVKQVNRILKERGKKPEYVEEGTSNTDFKWNRKHDSDLFHAHNVAHLEGKAPWRDAHRLWTDLHPKYAFVTLDQLRDRLTYLKKNPPDENFPWTKEENKELLNIYDKTMPDEEDQGQRIYDIWSKIHPRYKFMTPYYLQIHASTLAYKREMEGISKPLRKIWTPREKADLVEIYRRYVGKPAKRHEFHKEWTRKYPRLAYLTNSYLKEHARQLENRWFNADSKKLGRGSSRQKGRKYSSQGKQESYGGYFGALSNNHVHSKRLIKRCELEHKADTPLKFGSMKELIGGWVRGRSKKRSGKGIRNSIHTDAWITMVVYHSDEQESLPSNMSESSE